MKSYILPGLRPVWNYVVLNYMNSVSGLKIGPVFSCEEYVQYISTKSSSIYLRSGKTFTEQESTNVYDWIL